MAFRVFCHVSKLYFSFIKTTVLRGNKQKMSETRGDTVVIKSRWFPCFLLAGDPEGNTPIGSPTFFQHFPKSPQYPLGSAQMVSKSF
jgi:hypothetical protein